MAKKIVIVGGGLAGLVTSIQLAKEGIDCTVIEKGEYPFHRVCGEYVSNEVVPYLETLGIFPHELSPASISNFQFTSVNGKSATLPLDLGGFGISRYSFDYFLFQKAKSLGVAFDLNSEVLGISYVDEHFRVQTATKTYIADVAIASHGKRSKLDISMSRPFIQERSPYTAIKYHIKLPSFPSNLIGVHNFENGYCGISRVEDQIINMCYLTHRKNLRFHRNVAKLEKMVLFKNPYLKKIFQEAEFLWEKPIVINEVSFTKKNPVENHILFAGDAAGMIAPLCGNGMAMAIHSAKILSHKVLRFCNDDTYSRENLEVEYSQHWNRQFAKRMWIGRKIQYLYGNALYSNFLATAANYLPSLCSQIIKLTHGKPFK